MHLNTEAALDLIEGRLNEDQLTFWREHIERCTECEQDIHDWRRLAVDLKRSHLRNASDMDVETAVEILPAQAVEEGFSVRAVLASIVFDSVLQPAMAGVRGAAGSAARQLVMRAEEFDIHVKIWGDQNHRQMLGQLLPRKGQDFVRSARFHLLRNGERLESTATDDLGEFHFTDVPEGDLSLQIDLPNLTVIGALNLHEKS